MGDVTIIGAAGFVGTRLVESLVLDGYPGIRGVIRAYRSLASLARFGPSVTVRLADAEDSASLVPAVQGSSVVVNLTTGPPAGILPTTRSIYEACVSAGVPRLIHLSSAVIYGEATSPHLDDDAPAVRGHWMPYARAKAAAEDWLRERMGTSPCQVAVLRPGNVWGVRSPHTMSIVKSLIERRAYLVGDGSGVFHCIFIDNLVAGLRRCCDHTGDVRGFYNVGDSEYVTWRDFYAALAGPLGYDMGRMPSVSDRHFPWSTRAVLEYVQLLPVVNDLYYWLRARLADSLKSRIKRQISGRYEYCPATMDYVANPVVDREVWHLQKVRHKLPVAKFSQHFDFTPPVTFDEGVRRTLRWLAYLGYELSPDTVPAAHL
jgi:nucleoside-diphosphate-sugar epimerase